MMSDERRYWFVIDKGKLEYVQDNVAKEKITVSELEDLLNEQQEQLDLYKEAILTMLGILADKGIIFSGVKDE